ncbi:MAG: nucleotidyl transferase AbiEii/AbiGii toxin family protein [Candidatus Nealsonbacteria bacterium]|nr:nucleotidyl transferase AbiEii/AbiGii toxin family protein [Candidatus Nealsonbacteria bacterium]
MTNLELIKNILEENKDTGNIFKRNIIKEYLQVLVLFFIYSSKKHNNLIFYGGSSLRYCFDLPRLSEDLDFVDLKKNIKLSGLADNLKVFFNKETGLEPKIKIQKFRIYLKFPILYELNLAKRSESDILILKIEIFNEFDFCKGYKIQVAPVFKYGKSILIRTFDLPTLMATKIRAILRRKWEKTDKSGKTLAKIKGRDYFDLMWYLERGVVPNLKCIENIKNKEDLKKKLLEAVNKVDSRSIKFDLESLIADREFVNNLSKNLKSILRRNL